MAIEMRQQMKLSQQLVMTPQLQQAIRLLQLSTLDLQQEIQEALESNPMLEIEEDFDTDAEDTNHAGSAAAAAGSEAAAAVTEAASGAAAPRRHRRPVRAPASVRAA